jgi:D-xylose 1-dehydrogenase (NADP+, D-xylono-1,5-lactone-forming)
MYRYHPRYEAIKELIHSGEIGEIRGIHGTFTFNNAADKDNIRYKRFMGGGSIYDVGCYPISAARFILDKEPVAATVQAFFSEEHDNVDMMSSGLIEFPDSVALTFDCGMWAAPRNTLEIIGTEGRIEVTSAFLGSRSFFIVKKDQMREVEFPQVNQYALQADSFAESIFQKETLRFGPLDAVKNMQVIDACLKSAKDRVRVEIT